MIGEAIRNNDLITIFRLFGSAVFLSVFSRYLNNLRQHPTPPPTHAHTPTRTHVSGQKFERHGGQYLPAADNSDVRADRPLSSHGVRRGIWHVGRVVFVRVGNES